MSETPSASTSAKAAGKSAKRSPTDIEFLPAALEILETPHSPVRAALIWFICVLSLAAVVWSYVGTFDIVATAQGKLQPTGRVKVIQSTESGRTLSAPVANGARVKQGQVLVELDATELEAEAKAVEVNLQSLDAEVARRSAVIEAVERWEAKGIWDDTNYPDAAIVFPDDIPNEIRQRESRSYAADLAQLDSTVRSLAAQRLQAQASIDRLTEMVSAQKTLVETLTSRVSMRSNLLDVSAGSKAGVIDALEQQQKEQASLAEQSGQLSEAKAALGVATQDGVKAVKSFLAENVQRLVEASRQSGELSQQLIKARKQVRSMTITSPIDGTIQASAITTIGQVISPGAELMRVVPLDSSLEIEAYLPNSEIGFVSTGQPAVIKIEAFPFTRYGIINGHVTAIATDAIPEPDAQQLQKSQPAKELQSIIPYSNAQRVQNLVFPITIKPDGTTIDIAGIREPLSAGMAVTVEIKTGKRRIIEYLFSPLAEISSQAMQER